MYSLRFYSMVQTTTPQFWIERTSLFLSSDTNFMTNVIMLQEIDFDLTGVSNILDFPGLRWVVLCTTQQCNRPNSHFYCKLFIELYLCLYLRSKVLLCLRNQNEQRSPVCNLSLLFSVYSLVWVIPNFWVLHFHGKHICFMCSLYMCVRVGACVCMCVHVGACVLIPHCRTLPSRLSTQQKPV